MIVRIPLWDQVGVIEGWATGLMVSAETAVVSVAADALGGV